MEAKITVIIPIYNMEQYLAECLESVINQSIYDIEILCINDGSTDKSLQILQKYGEQDVRFIIINQENKGVAYSRNLGIQKATGKYVMFMDPDDRYPASDTIEKLYKAVEEHGVKIAGGTFSDFDLNGNVNSISDYENDMLNGYLFEKNQIMEYKDYQFDYGYHRFIYNKQFLIDNNIFFPDLIRFQDPPFMVKALTLAERFYAITDITYCYRLNHKEIEWNENKVDSLLRGLQMNLQWAWENKLYDLYDLIIRRIVIEYKEAIIKQFAISIPNERLLLAILGDLKGDEQIRKLMWMVIETYQKMNVKSREEVQTEIGRVRELNVGLQKMHEIISEKNRDILTIQKKYTEQVQHTKLIQESLSYKIGRLITWIPRKVKILLRNK